LRGTPEAPARSTTRLSTPSGRGVVVLAFFIDDKPGSPPLSKRRDLPFRPRSQWNPSLSASSRRAPRPAAARRAARRGKRTPGSSAERAGSARRPPHPSGRTCQPRSTTRLSAIQIPSPYRCVSARKAEGAPRTLGRPFRSSAGRDRRLYCDRRDQPRSDIADSVTVGLRLTGSSSGRLAAGHLQGPKNSVSQVRTTSFPWSGY
jgi:hypothetical protein